MKFIWEPADIHGGVRYTKIDISEIWIIGYMVENDVDKKYASVSLADGIVLSSQSAEKMATMLNEEGYIPLHCSDKREREPR